jgi:hypothetical protein
LDDYLTIDQLAAELDVAVITLKRWGALRQGPPVTKIGRRVLYRRSAVQAWLLRQEQKTRRLDGHNTDTGYLTQS